jgi:GT2 family glycosyltransferase/glycosyltransferase involved in cell wall biosynthesis
MDTKTINEPTPAGAAIDATRQIDDAALRQRIDEWREQSKSKRKRYVLYTAIAGNYDVLKVPEFLNPYWDYVCFSDRADYPGDHPWQIRPFDYINADPTRTARYAKINPHLYFPEYECSVWIDAHLLAKENFLHKFMARFLEGGQLFAAVPHPFRRCTYLEAQQCQADGKDDVALIEEQVSRYRREGLPETYGLIESGVLVRQHNDPAMRRFATTWWNELNAGSRRDQLSLMYAIWKSDLKWMPLIDGGKSVRGHRGFRFFQHGLNWSRRDAQYRVPDFLPAAYAEDRTPFWTRPPEVFDRAMLAPFERMDVDVAVCVHNALDDVRACLESVLAAWTPTQHIHVIDDGSDTPTASYLADLAAAHPHINLVRHEQALGYTRSASEGMRVGTAPFVVLLNSDTIVSPDWTLKMLQTAFSAPGIGVVGPMSNAASWQSLPLVRDPVTGRMAVNALPDGMSCADMDRLCEQKGFKSDAVRVPLVNGFCYGIKREVIDAIGVFDHEAFPRGYGEEDDFSMRALKAGFMHALATHCYVFHAKSKSFGSETRLTLAAAGGKALRARHGDRHIAAAVQTMAQHPVLRMLREEIGTACGVANAEPLPRELPRLASRLIGPPAPVAPPDVAASETRPAPPTALSEAELKEASRAELRAARNEAALLKAQELTRAVAQADASLRALAKISSAELDMNAAFVRQMRGRAIGPVRTAVWMMPATRNILAGGIRTLLMVAEDWSRTLGTVNHLVFYQTKSKLNEISTAEIERHFPALRFSVIHHDVEADPADLPLADIALCSSWPTAYLLARYNKCRAKFYFMQDYETLFYPAGSISSLIDQTYDFGFHCIANTESLAKRYRQFSDAAIHFLPGVDRQVFRPPTQPPSTDPLQVVFYARPDKPRNGFDLGIEALRLVKQHFGDSVRIVTVGGAWRPVDHDLEGVVEQLGVLTSLDDVAELYRRSHVGLVLMLTPHPSYQPLEYMACGCVTVTNKNLGTDWLFVNGENAVLTSVLPTELARGVIRALSDASLRARVVAGGLKTVESMDWAQAFATIRSYVANPDNLSQP